MCVCFVSSAASAPPAAMLGAADRAGSLGPSWNIKPGQIARAVRCDANRVRRLEALCWGLMPAYVRSGRQRKRAISTVSNSNPLVASTPVFPVSRWYRRTMVSQ